MLAFALGFLATVTVRAEMPDVGRQVAAAIAAAAIVAGVATRTARPRDLRHALLAAALGAVAAGAAPPAREAQRPGAPETLDARAAVARVEGVVQPGGRVDERGCWFRLAHGPRVRVAGARFTPPPGATVSVLGRLDPAGSTLASPSPDALTLIAPAHPFSPAGFFERLRQLCRERIASACDPETARILLPLLIGDTGLPEALREDLARTGTLHIVAVSGTHLSLFLAGLRIFTRRVRVLVPLLVVYAGMCAFDPPVLRSLVLAIGYLCGRRLGRALPQASHLLLSACVVLAFDPPALFDAGFQLSFSAFAGIVAVGEPSPLRAPLERVRDDGPAGRLRGLLRNAGRTGAGAMVATAPAMVWRFNRLSPIGIPATILLAPLIPFLLWLGALIVIFPSVPAFANLASALTGILARLAAAISALPIASFDVPQPHAPALAAFAGAIALAGLRGGRASPRARIGIVALGTALVTVPDRAPPGLYQLTAHRGAATLLVSEDAAALVDVGPRSANAAEQILKLGIRRVDLVVLTHDHADHTGGLGQVLSRLAVTGIAAGESHHPPCAVSGLEVASWAAGSAFDRPGLVIEAVWPPRGGGGSDNDRSLVVAARSGGLRALLCGDLESPGLTALLGTVPIPRVDVLLLPHHGAANDALGELLLRTRPRWALLAARAGAPAEETLRALALRPTRVRATYLEGLIAIRARDVDPPRPARGDYRLLNW